MSSIDEQFVEFVVKSLVNKPDMVKVERRIDEKGVLLELTVDPEDLGRVIGKRGATAQSIRTLLRALGTKNDARYNLKIVDNGTYSPSSRSSSEDNQVDDTSSSTASDDSQTDVDTKSDDVADDNQPEPASQDESAEDQQATSDKISKARKELAELDDLDV